MAEWVRALAWNGDRTFPAGFETHFGKNFSLRNFGNSVYPSLFSSVFRMRPVQWRIVGSRGPGVRYIVGPSAIRVNCQQCRFRVGNLAFRVPSGVFYIEKIDDIQLF